MSNKYKASHAQAKALAALYSGRSLISYEVYTDPTTAVLIRNSWVDCVEEVVSVNGSKGKRWELSTDGFTALASTLDYEWRLRRDGRKPR